MDINLCVLRGCAAHRQGQNFKLDEGRDDGQVEMAAAAQVQVAQRQLSQESRQHLHCMTHTTQHAAEAPFKWSAQAAQRLHMQQTLMYTTQHAEAAPFKWFAQRQHRDCTHGNHSCTPLSMQQKQHSSSLAWATQRSHVANNHVHVH